MKSLEEIQEEIDRASYAVDVVAQAVKTRIINLIKTDKNPMEEKANRTFLSLKVSLDDYEKSYHSPSAKLSFIEDCVINLLREWWTE